MQHLFIGFLAIAGIVWNVDLGAKVYVDWIMVALIAAFMFIMGARFDEALRRWENQPHWKKTQPESVSSTPNGGSEQSAITPEHGKSLSFLLALLEPRQGARAHRTSHQSSSMRQRICPVWSGPQEFS
jgi:hypothetical protein